ncbi:Uncharacterised protein [Bordetella pertussis]|nr:Uncharacterised protein [Bordetella pertussis]
MVDEPSVSQPSRNCTTSSTPASTACCLASTLPSSETDLISQCSQRSSSMAIALRPWVRCAAPGGLKAAAMPNTVGVIGSVGKA